MAFLSVNGQGGLVILDLADPDRPYTLSSLPISGGLHNAWKEGRYVYCNQEIFGWLASLYIIDVSDPSNPVEVGRFRAQPPPFSPIEGPHNSWIQGGLLYWAYYDAGLRVLDISVPDRPVEIGYHPAVSAWGAQPYKDGLVYVADSGLGGLLALRFHDPAYVVRQVSLTPDVAISGQDNSIKVAASTAPSPRGVKGQIARVSARFFNYGDAEEWALLDNGASGDATGGDGVFTGRVQVPADQPNGRYRLRVQVEDDQGFIYSYEIPFRVLPSEDMVIFDEALANDWTAAPANGVKQMDLQNQVVYQGQFAQALEVDSFNLKYSPAKPIDAEGYTSLRFAFHPGKATVASGGTFNAVIRYRFRPGGFGLKVGETERYLNVKLLGEDVEEGMRVRMEQKEWQVVEIPLTFPEVGSGSIQILEIRLGGKLQGTFYLDDLRLVKGAPPPVPTAVLEDYASSRPQRFTLSQNFPNPFNSSTMVRFELPQSGEVELAVYNLAGQQVAKLMEGVREAGAYTLRWDGKDERGKELASGVYLYRLRAGERVETRKLLLLR